MLIFKAKMKNFGKAQLFFLTNFSYIRNRMESDNELCPLCQTLLNVLPVQLLPSVCNELQIHCNPLAHMRSANKLSFLDCFRTSFVFKYIQSPIQSLLEPFAAPPDPSTTPLEPSTDPQSRTLYSLSAAICSFATPLEPYTAPLDHSSAPLTL